MSSSKPVIKVKGLKKSFKSWESLPDRQLKSQLIKWLRLDFRKGDFRKTTILDDVSFEVFPGEFLGIMGRNGIGKSTILKLLAGIYQPTDGSVEVKGRIAPLLELGAGFDPELTGHENIYLNATMLGCSLMEVEAIIDNVIEFSGLKEKIHLPLKNYSSGMLVRLGFSIAVHVDFDILLLDEVLGVGDVSFYNKCTEKIKELHNSGKTILLVTHHAEVANSVCQRCIVLEDTKKIYDGEVEGAIRVYNNVLLAPSSV